MQNTTHVNECMHSYNVNTHDANAMMENLMCCYAYDACMHAWQEKYKMICYVQKCLIDNDLMHAQKS